MHVPMRARSIIVLFLTFGGIVATGCKRPPRALDPLTPLERKEAERIARSDSEVGELLGAGRTELVYVDFVVMKPANKGPAEDPGRFVSERVAEVVFYRFDGDFGVRALVSIGPTRPRRVLKVQRLESANVPLTGQDLTEAWRLARESKQIRQMLGSDAAKFLALDPLQSNAAHIDQNTVHSILVTPAGSNDPCYGHRCLELFFRRSGIYLPNVVIVDLSAQTIQVQ